MAHLGRNGAACVGLALGGCTLLLDYGDEAQLAARGAADAGPIEAGTSADAAADGPALPFCESRQPRPMFCASFDGPGYLAEWSDSNAVGARLERDTESSVSPPASLRITAEPGAPAVSAAVGTGFAGWGSGPFSFTSELDIQVVDAAPTGALAVLATPLLIFSNNQPAYLLQLVGRPLADGSSISLEVVEVSNEGGGTRGHAATVSLQRGVWAHVVISLVRGDDDNAVSLSVNGQTGFSGPLEVALPSGALSASFGLATVDSNTTAWTYRFDNVTIDLR